MKQTTTTGNETVKENPASALMRQRAELKSELQRMSREELIAECIENTEQKEMAIYFLLETKQHDKFISYSNQKEKEANYVI